MERWNIPGGAFKTVDEQYFFDHTMCMNYFMHIVFLLFLFSSCTSEKIPGGRVIVGNDILDKEFNSFFIDQIITSRGMMGVRKKLAPGEEYVIPYPGIRKIRFVRAYADHSKVYQVTCPSTLDTEVTLKLIDVHTNRLGGGCALVKRGKMSTGGLVRWE
jgi:hypothetical protein